MKKDIEENNIQHEVTILGLMKKQQEAVCELSEQMKQLKKLRAKYEKDKVPLKMQVEESKIALDHILHEKALNEKNLVNLENQLKSQESKISELGLTLGSQDLQNKRIFIENSEHVSKLEELLISVSMLQKSKSFLADQLEEAKQSHGEEVKERQALVARHRNLDMEDSRVRDQLDDAIQQREDSVREAIKVETPRNMIYFVQKFKEIFSNENLIGGRG